MDRIRSLRSSAIPAVVLFVVFTLLNALLSHRFMGIGAWTGFLQATVPVVLLSMGEAVVIIGGGIDISMASTVAVVNTLMATLSGANGPIGLPVLVCMIVALGFGLMNGFLVAVLRITPLLATFATSFIGSGLALTILPAPGGQVPGALSDLYYSVILGCIPVPLVFAIIVFLLWQLIRISPLGLYIYATGHDAEKAYFSGVRVSRVTFVTYVFAGFSAGFAGVAVSSNFGTGDPNIGASMTLASVAACVIGGVDLAGGSGTMIGPAFGAVFLYEILITVLGLGVPAYFQELVTGLIVVLGITGAVALQKRGQKLEAY